MSWDEAEKVAYPSSLPHFSLLSMHEAVGEAVLPNSFSKIAQLHLESCSKSYLKNTTLLIKLSCAKQALNCLELEVVPMRIFGPFERTLLPDS